ncbi:hypothetical protein KM043_002810 [Ampulex compressa]|nr:hypothetical protein KM043_002810 [Ampulex compressa]
MGRELGSAGSLDWPPVTPLEISRTSTQLRARNGSYGDSTKARFSRKTLLSRRARKERGMEEESVGRLSVEGSVDGTKCLGRKVIEGNRAGEGGEEDKGLDD